MELVSLLKERGATGLNDIQVGESKLFAGSGRALFATKDFIKNSELFRIPKNCCVSYQALVTKCPQITSHASLAAEESKEVRLRVLSLLAAHSPAAGVFLNNYVKSLPTPEIFESFMLKL